MNSIYLLPTLMSINQLNLKLDHPAPLIWVGKRKSIKILRGASEILLFGLCCQFGSNKVIKKRDLNTKSLTAPLKLSWHTYSGSSTGEPKIWKATGNMSNLYLYPRHHSVKSGAMNFANCMLVTLITFPGQR